MHNYLPKKFYYIDNYDINNIKNITSDIGIIFRNYSTKIDRKQIIKIKEFCKKKGIKLFLGNDIKSALSLSLDGAYIPSFNHNFNHLNFMKRKNFLLIGSAHNVKELRIKETQLVSCIFLSSIFKKNKNYLGLYKFRNLMSLTNKKVYALGGISKGNIKMLKNLKVSGFAAISFFK